MADLPCNDCQGAICRVGQDSRALLRGAPYVDYKARTRIGIAYLITGTIETLASDIWVHCPRARARGSANNLRLLGLRQMRLGMASVHCDLWGNSPCLPHDPYQPGELEMKSVVTSFSRRALLGAGLAIPLLPHLASAQDGRDPASQEPTDMKIKATFNNQNMIATLYDNPSARDLYSMLPLDLTIDNYANNEKIAYLPRKLTEEGSGPFDNETPGDLCYFAPWGNLALFYAGYRWSDGLIRLGRLKERTSSRCSCAGSSRFAYNSTSNRKETT